MQEFWKLVVNDYPLRLGGTTQLERCVARGYPVRLKNKIEGFVCHNRKKNRWDVHESTTGGLLCSGKTRADAVEKSNAGILKTPDIMAQMAKAGAIMDKPVCGRVLS